MASGTAETHNSYIYFSSKTDLDNYFDAMQLYDAKIIYLDSAVSNALFMLNAQTFGFAAKLTSTYIDGFVTSSTAIYGFRYSTSSHSLTVKRKYTYTDV